MRIDPDIARKHKIHRIISPEAPLKDTPNPVNSMGADPCLNSATTTNAAINAKGRPIIAGKFFTTSAAKTGSKRLIHAVTIRLAVAAIAANAMPTFIVCRQRSMALPLPQPLGLASGLRSRPSTVGHDGYTEMCFCCALVFAGKFRRKSLVQKSSSRCPSFYS